MSDPSISNGDRPSVETSPRFVITIIHGRFSSKAKWARKGSPFREGLTKRFGAEVIVRRRVWDSKKDEDPAGRLSKFVRRYADRYPNAQQILVCRAHRGTAAIYAMQDQFLRSRAAGIACLEWPFAVTEERSIRKPLSISAWFAELFIIAAAILSSAIGATLLRALRGKSGIGFLSLKAAACLLIITSIAVLAWYLFVMRPLRIRRALHARLFPIMEKRQKAAMARLAIPSKLEMPILWQEECGGSSPVRDEARFRIWIAQFFLRNIEVSPEILYMWQGFAVLVMLIASVYLFVGVFGSGAHDFSQLRGIWLLCTWPIWSILGILLWASRMWIFRFLVFGDTSLLDVFALKTVTEYSPDGPGVLEKKGFVSSSTNICLNTDFGDWLVTLPKRQFPAESDIGRPVSARI